MNCVKTGTLETLKDDMALDNNAKNVFVTIISTIMLWLTVTRK